VIGYDAASCPGGWPKAIGSCVPRGPFEPLLTGHARCPTARLQLAVVRAGRLGALVITASHQPARMAGPEDQGSFGAFVEGDFTARSKRAEAGGLNRAGARRPPPLRWLDETTSAACAARFDTSRLRRGLTQLGCR